MSDDGTGSEVPDDEGSEPVAPNRRALLLGGGGAVAGALAASALGAVPADAADGQALIIGQANSGAATTFLTGSSVQISVSGGNGALFGSTSQSNGIGLAGSNSAATGVGTGVFGLAGGGASGGFGVRGIVNPPSTTGIGVSGEVAQGTGVNGHASGDAGVGVRARADGAGGAALDATATSSTGAVLRLSGGPAAMPPTTGTWTTGSVVVFGGQLWFCYQGGTGTASRWSRLSSSFLPLKTPVRCYDSRPGDPPLGVTKGQLLDGQERVIDATVGGGVPAGARSIQVNLTVVNTGPAGFLALFANGVAWPGNSSINWTVPGTVLANGTLVTLDATGKFKARAKSNTDLIVDVLGYHL
jgi:hypothetical protein